MDVGCYSRCMTKILLTRHGHVDGIRPAAALAAEQLAVNAVRGPSVAGDVLGRLRHGEQLLSAERDALRADQFESPTGSGHRGGPISYSVNGKQYIAVPSGLGSLVLGLYPALWPEVEDFPSGAAMFVFTLK